MTFIIVFIGWIFSLCLHEFAHAIVAYYGGDYTVKEKGYLTFNPLRYTDPLLSIVLPIFFLIMGGIGLPGGAVYIERWRIRNRYWLSGMSLAGPAANVLVAIVLAIIIQLTDSRYPAIQPGLAFLLFLQISAVLFNLIPLPPFDGYNILDPFLNPAIRMQVDRIRPFSMWIVFLVFWYVPFVSEIFSYVVLLIALLLGADPTYIGIGWNNFRFWEL